MIRTTQGYTLVEVMIVIAVIGILATIATVSWNGVTISSRNNLRAQDINTWSATFDTYKGRYSAYPVMPGPSNTSPATAVTYCLGSFTDLSSKCGAYTSSSSTQGIPASGSLTLLSEVEKIGKVPKNNKDLAVSNKLAGPILSIYQTGSSPVTVTARIISFFENACPTEFVEETSGSFPTATMLTSAAVSNAKACGITKQFSYDPS